MHPLQNGSQVTERPANKPVSGLPGYFTESGENNVPSYPGADWFNNVIDEFLNCLDAAGISYDPNKLTNLASVIRSKVGKSGAKKNYLIRLDPSNEDITEWYRPAFYDVTSFSTIESGADNAFSLTVDEMLSDGGGKMLLPSSTYSVNNSLIPDRGDTAGKFVIEGENQITTKISTSNDQDLIFSREHLTISEVSLNNLNSDKVGRAITTNDIKQSALSSHRDMTIEGWRFGIWHRYSIWNEFRNLTLSDNACGIRLSRHSYRSDNSNPEPTGGWNEWNNGWFHNALVFDNVYCEGGEVGVWGSMMCATFLSCTTQGQHADGASNEVLPNNFNGVGLLIDCGSDSSRIGWNNVVINQYCEHSDVGIYAIGQKYLGIDGMFMQGGLSSDPAKSVLVSDNSLVMAKGVCGQDYFSQGIFKALNNSKLVLEGGYQDPLSDPAFTVDATSEILPRGQCDLDKHVYRLFKPLGNQSMSFVLPMVVPDLSVASLYFFGLYDGYITINGECTTYNWNASVASEVRWHPKFEFNQGTGEWDISNAPPSGISVDVSNSGVITVTLTVSAII